MRERGGQGVGGKRVRIKEKGEMERREWAVIED